jgi:hypothetical protein
MPSLRSDLSSAPTGGPCDGLTGPKTHLHLVSRSDHERLAIESRPMEVEPIAVDSCIGLAPLGLVIARATWGCRIIGRPVDRAVGHPRGGGATFAPCPYLRPLRNLMDPKSRGSTSGGCAPTWGGAGPLTGGWAYRCPCGEAPGRTGADWGRRDRDRSAPGCSPASRWAAPGQRPPALPRAATGTGCPCRKPCTVG